MEAKRGRGLCRMASLQNHDQDSHSTPAHLLISIVSHALTRHLIVLHVEKKERNEIGRDRCCLDSTFIYNRNLQKY